MLPQRWVSTRKHQCTTGITTMWTESSWAFPESYTADESWIVRSSDGGNWETKGLITTQPRWVSVQLLYVCVIAWWRSQGCSQNLCSPFLRAGRFHYIILLYYILLYWIILYYITRHIFSPTRSVIYCFLLWAYYRTSWWTQPQIVTIKTKNCYLIKWQPYSW